MCVKLGDNPSAAAFLYTLASENRVEVKPIDDSTMIVKTESTLSLASVLQSLTDHGFAWQSLEEYLVNKAD